MNCSQVGSHVVLAVELLVTHATRVGLAVQVGGHVMPVEVGGVSIGIVANFAPVSVALLDTEAPDADGIGVISRGIALLR